MKPERARERYQLKIELVDPGDVDPRWPKKSEIPLLVAEMFIPVLRWVPLFMSETRPFAAVGPDERVVTVLEKESKKQVMQFLAPAGDEAQALIADMHHDYKRLDADEWREKWLDQLPTAFGPRG